MIGPDDLPGVNAILNSTSVVLLVSGYVAIKNRKIILHKALMLTALATSAVFLSSYLYFHLVHRHGQATHFEDQAPLAPNGVKYLYRAILLTHTILAAATAPMALTVAYLGIKDRLAGHKKLARWTLPIWLYVSITGVVVYWMLYRLYA
jgi:putative membrane protein